MGNAKREGDAGLINNGPEAQKKSKMRISELRWQKLVEDATNIKDSLDTSYISILSRMAQLINIEAIWNEQYNAEERSWAVELEVPQKNIRIVSTSNTKKAAKLLAAGEAVHKIIASHDA